MVSVYQLPSRRCVNNEKTASERLWTQSNDKDMEILIVLSFSIYILTHVLKVHFLLSIKIMIIQIYESI